MDTTDDKPKGQPHRQWRLLLVFIVPAIIGIMLVGGAILFRLGQQSSLDQHPEKIWWVADLVQGPNNTLSYEGPDLTEWAKTNDVYTYFKNIWLPLKFVGFEDGKNIWEIEAEWTLDFPALPGETPPNAYQGTSRFREQ